MTSFLTAKSDSPEFASKQLKDKLVSFVATDLRPCTAVEGEGFLSLCQTLVEYGAKYGQFDVRKSMPCRTTTSRHVDPIVNVIKKQVKEELQKARFIALTSDGWTDDFRKVSYITVTASYFDSNMQLYSRILNTGEVEERKTEDVLGKAVSVVMAEYGFSLGNITIVTDNAANMVAAFRDRCCCMSCFAHCLNLVMIDGRGIESEGFETLLTNCKAVVRHFKHTGLQRKLKRTLKQECPTRLNSTYTMLESILSHYDEMHGILKKRIELKYLYAVDIYTLFQIVNFFEHFRVASEKACSNSRPTLHFVLPLY